MWSASSFLKQLQVICINIKELTIVCNHITFVDTFDVTFDWLLYTGLTVFNATMFATSIVNILRAVVLKKGEPIER